MLFLDIETKNTGEMNFIQTQIMQISYVGVIDDNGAELDFWEKDLPNLKPLLENTDWVVGYNSIGFDLPVIGNYLGEDINNVAQLDLMVALYKTIGFRPKLNDVVTATLNKGKIAKGSDAPVFFANGEFDKLKQYCMEDVRLTKELYDFGIANGYVNYFDKQGFIKKVNIDWNLGKKEKKVEEQTLSLF